MVDWNNGVVPQSFGSLCQVAVGDAGVSDSKDNAHARTRRMNGGWAKVKSSGKEPSSLFLKIIAIVVAIALTSAAVVHFVTPRPRTKQLPKPMADFGPKVSVSFDGTAPLGNNTTICVQMYSPVPDAFVRTGMRIYNTTPANQLNNSVNDELLNVTLQPENNTTAFFMTPVFDTIAGQWTHLLSKDTGNNYPSLTVIAVKTVDVNGTIKLYQYYNNLPYNPFELSILHLNNSTMQSPSAVEWFANTGVNTTDYSQIYLANLNFELALVFPQQPLEVIHSVGSGSNSTALSMRTAMKRLATADSSCYTWYSYSYSNTTSDTLEKTTYANGTLPLIGAHIGRNADQGGSLVDIGASVTITSDNISLNSNQVYVPSSGTTTTTMSTQPSFAHLANVSVAASGNSYAAIPRNLSESNGNNFSVSQNRTTAFAGVQGVEYEFQHYNRYTYEHKYTYYNRCCDNYPYGTVCYPPKLVSSSVIKTTYDGNYTIGEIIHINSTAGLEVQAGYASIWEAWVIQHFLLQDSNGTIQLTDSGNTSSYQAATIWAMTYGWTNAGNAYAEAVNALNIFSSALSLGLAIISVAAAANAIDLDSTEAVVVSTAASIVAAVTAQAATLLGLFSSISFISGSHQVTNAYWVTNQPFVGSGSNYAMPFYESSGAVTFTLPNGNSYLFYAPEDYLNATAIV